MAHRFQPLVAVAIAGEQEPLHGDDQRPERLLDLRTWHSKDSSELGIQRDATQNADRARCTGPRTRTNSNHESTKRERRTASSSSLDDERERSGAQTLLSKVEPSVTGSLTVTLSDSR
jgi:hypothetical protein